MAHSKRSKKWQAGKLAKLAGNWDRIDKTIIALKQLQAETKGKV